MVNIIIYVSYRQVKRSLQDDLSEWEPALFRLDNRYHFPDEWSGLNHPLFNQFPVPNS